MAAERVREKPGNAVPYPLVKQGRLAVAMPTKALSSAFGTRCAGRLDPRSCR